MLRHKHGHRRTFGSGLPSRSACIEPCMHKHELEINTTRLRNAVCRQATAHRNVLLNASRLTSRTSWDATSTQISCLGIDCRTSYHSLIAAHRHMAVCHWMLQYRYRTWKLYLFLSFQEHGQRTDGLCSVSLPAPNGSQTNMHNMVLWQEQQLAIQRHKIFRLHYDKERINKESAIGWLDLQWSFFLTNSLESLRQVY